MADITTDSGSAPGEPLLLDRAALRGAERAVGALLDAAGAVGRLLDDADAAQEVVADIARDAARAADRVTDAVDAGARKARRAAAELDQKLRARPAYERGLDVLEGLGFARQDVPGVAYQLQIAIRSPKPVPLPFARGLAFSLTTQFAVKAEFASGPDVDKLTARYDGPSRSLRQIELELGKSLGAFDIGGLIEVVSIKPKVTVDVPAGSGRAPGAIDPTRVPGGIDPAGGLQLGLEGTFRLPRVIDPDTGKPYELKSRAAVKVDLRKLLDAGHWTEFASVIIDVLPIKIPIDSSGVVKALRDRVGGSWTMQLKVLLEVSATLEAWMRFCDVLKRVAVSAKDAVVYGARAAVEGATQVALDTGRLAMAVGRTAVTAPSAPLVGIGLAATAAAFATAVVGKLAIGHELTTGRDRAVANAYCAGYAEELGEILALDPGAVAARVWQYKDYDFKAALDEISAVVHGREPRAYYVLRPGLTAQDVDAAAALVGPARDLGRAGALVGIHGFLIHHAFDQSPDTALDAWSVLRDRVRDPALIAGLSRAGYAGLRPRFTALLSAQVAGQGQDVNEIGLPLEQLERVVAIGAAP